MKILTRNDWRAARTGRSGDFITMSARSEFVVHHTAGPATQSVADIQQFHIQKRGWVDIGYNFLVRGTTGEVYEGRGWNEVGAHSKGHNRDGLGVAVIGNDTLAAPAKDSLRALYATACEFAGHPLMIRGHRDHAPTECPGDRIYAWITSGALEPIRQRTLSVQRPYLVGPDVRQVQKAVGADVDGIYGPDTAADVRLWQLAHALVPDGIVGPKTWAKLISTR